MTVGKTDAVSLGVTVDIVEGLQVGVPLGMSEGLQVGLRVDLGVGMVIIVAYGGSTVGAKEGACDCMTYRSPLQDFPV